GERVAVHSPRSGEWRTLSTKAKQKWVGYDRSKAETDVLKFRQAGDTVEVVLHENPFYAEAGGQVSDTGTVKGEGGTLDVEGVEKGDGLSAVVGHFAERVEPTPVVARADERRRWTGGVERRGELHVWEYLHLTARDMKYQAAVAAGAMAFFTEKYGDIVRVVDVPGVSLELCGGTHVPTTGQIALFRFTHETGAAAGVRRIEAVTGPGAYALIRELEGELEQAAGTLRTQPEHLVRRIEQLLEENRKLVQRIEGMLRAGPVQPATSNVQRIDDV